MGDYHNMVIKLDDTYYAVPIGPAGLKDPREPILTPRGVPKDWVDLDDDEEGANRILALRLHRDEWETPITSRRGNEFTMGKKSWLVLTGQEADDECERRLNDRIDNVLDIPPEIEPYFNRERWKADIKKYGRGNVVSCYDNTEINVLTAFNTFYIFRQT